MTKAADSARHAAASASRIAKTAEAFVVEILLWLLCIPGIIYSWWRRSNKIEKCAYCEKDGVLPVESPEAKAIRAGKSG